ncbi:MAG: FG-GAP-like repeat-containing protein, partial [Bacteroidota bacterium]
MNRVALLIGFLAGSGLTALAQGPVITSVSDSVAFPGKEIIISGSGFNPDTAKTQVWFGQVKGKTIAATAFSVVARVPAQARLSNLEVINTGNGLSVKTDNKFLPFFSGGGLGADGYPIAGSTPAGKDFRTFPSLTSNLPFFDICTCDLDGDGKPEAIASRPKSDLRLLILRNTSVPGNLSFAEQNPLINFPIQNLICGDVDGDGKPDLLASKSRVGTSAGNAVYVFRNKSIPGTIQFDPGKELRLPATNDEAGYLVLRDLNLDGRPDLVVTNSQVSALSDLPMYIFVNESVPGTVSFQSAPVPLSTTGMKQTYGLEIQDFTGDDKPDIAVADKAAGTIRIFPNTSTLAISFGQPYSKVLAGTFINRMIAADFNRDGRPDLAVTDITSNKIILLYNTAQTGVPSFGAPVAVTTADSPDGIDVGDLDGDTDPDLAIACKGSKLTVLLNSGAAVPTFTRYDYATQRDVRNIVAADMDGDAKPDLAVITFKLNSIPEAYTVDVYRNLSCFVPRIVNEQPLTNCLGPPVQPITLRSIPGFGLTGYTWNLNGTALTTTTGPSTVVTQQGAYSVTAVGECGAGKTSPPVTLTSNSGPVPPQPVVSSNTPVCEGGAISLSTAAVAGSPQYVWTRPDGSE